MQATNGELPLSREKPRSDNTSSILIRILGLRESENLECKEAKIAFRTEDLLDYCIAIANERGGHLVLGVTNTLPRRIVGSQAFMNINEIKSRILDSIHMRVDVQEKFIDGKRVLIFTIKSRPIGTLLQHKGRYLMRVGEALVSMTPEQLKSIFDEAEPDFSGTICPGVEINDLSESSVMLFRDMWKKKAGSSRMGTWSVEETLRNAKLLIDGGVTLAAVALFGTHATVSRRLPQAELIFEYRSKEGSINYQQRKDYREGFFCYIDDLVQVIELRNEVQQYREGLFVFDIKTFNKDIIREAVLNAISHRDYRLGESIIIRQFPQRLEIISPGPFPPGVNPNNILDQQSRRNRKIAETFQFCGLVERSGQGADKMFEESLKEGKAKPDYSESDNHRVFLRLDGMLRNPDFLSFLHKVGEQRSSSFSIHDLLLLDTIYHEEAIPDHYRRRLTTLTNMGVIEKRGRGKGTQYILSQQFYTHLGQRGVYTRKAGLDSETRKALLSKHLTSRGQAGAGIKELCQVLPELSVRQVRGLLQALREEGRVRIEGRTRNARWLRV